MGSGCPVVTGEYMPGVFKDLQTRKMTFCYYMGIMQGPVILWLLKAGHGQKVHGAGQGKKLYGKLDRAIV